MVKGRHNGLLHIFRDGKAGSSEVESLSIMIQLLSCFQERDSFFVELTPYIEINLGLFWAHTLSHHTIWFVAVFA